MQRVLLFAMLVVGTAPAQAQSSSATPQIAPGMDSAEQRRALRSFSTCLARSRPGWARRTLSHAYLSEAQASAAAEALSGNDTCILRDVELTFRTSGMVGSLAEYFLAPALDAADQARLSRTLNALTPRNTSEDFALCVAARNPAAARELALSDPGSSAEVQAAAALAAHVPRCTNPGEQLSVELPSLRSLMSVALYRGRQNQLTARK